MQKKGQYINKKKKSITNKFQVDNTTEKPEIKTFSTKRTDFANSKIIILGLFAILIVTFISYLPTFKNKITNWDDDKYIIENPLIKDFDGNTISKMFYSGTTKELYWMGNYHPLTMLTLNINYQMLSESDIDEDGNVTNPFIFQLTNILFHLINTVLVFLVVYILFKNFPIAFITALFFGVHTLHVESVTWISERKDVLYTMFFLFSLLFYSKYTEKFDYKNLILAFVFFMLSAFSKGQAVSLAVTLVAVDYFKNRNFLDIKLIAEKAVFIIVGLIFGLIAITAQKEGQAMQDIAHYGIAKRVLIASYGFMQYILKLFVPVNLSAIYPYPDIINKSIPIYYAAGFIFVALTGWALFYFYKKSREITFAIAFFVINIALLLQLIPVGSAIMADRYAYIPSIGFYILAAFILVKITEKNSAYKNYVILIVSVFTIFWAYLTFERTKVWESSMTLWNDVVTKQPVAVVAWNNKGSEYDKEAAVLKEEKDFEKYKEYKLQSISDFTKAIEGKPDYQHAFYNRGTAKKDFGETLNDTSYILSAIEDFDTAIKIQLDFAEAFQNRAICYEFLGYLQKALSDYNRTIEINPDKYEFYINRGVIKGKMGNLDSAIVDFNYVITNSPDNASAYSNRGLAYFNLGNNLQALEDYNKSIELDNEAYTAYYNRALVKSELNDFQGAIDDLNNVLKLEPTNLSALAMRGMIYIDLNMRDKACEDFNKLAELNDSYAIYYIENFCK